MPGYRDSSGGDTRAATVRPHAEPAAPDSGTPVTRTEDAGRGRRIEDAGRGRRPTAMTVVAVIAIAGFALWGIGGPLFGTSTLTSTNEMVSLGPWANAGFPNASDTNTYLDDIYTSELPSTILFKRELTKGVLAEWNPYGSGGSPLAAVPDYAFFSPLTIPFYVLPTWLAPAYERLLEIVCAAGGTFLFLRRLSLSRPAALLGGMVFAGSGFMVTWLGFPQTRVATFIPALFWTLERFVRLRRLRDAALVALPVAALILGGFPSVAGYALLTAVGYVLVRLISMHRHELRQTVRPLLYLTGSLVAGAGLTLFQMIPFLAFFRTWLIQGREQTPTTTLPIASILTTITPWPFGSVNPSQGTQFVLGPNMIEVVAYIGAASAVLVLVALAMPRQGRALLCRGMWVFFVAATAVWAELTYVGGPPLALVQKLPVLRTLFEQNFIGRARSITGFLLAVLVAIGFELLIRVRTRQPESLRGRRVWAGTVVVAGVVLLGGLVYHGRTAMADGANSSGQDVGDALSLYRNQVLIAVVLVAVATGCVVVLRLVGDPNSSYFRERAGKLVRLSMASVLMLITAAQGAQFMSSYYPHSPDEDFYPVTDSHTFLADNLGEQRYASSFNSIVFGTSTAYGLRSVNGHAFLNQNFAALINGIPDTPIPYPTYIDLAPGDPAQATSPVLDVLGTKYYVTDPGEPVFGVLQPAARSGTLVLRPGRPVSVPVPTTGPLRGLGFTPQGRIAESLTDDNSTDTVDVVLTDPAGRQVARSSRLTIGMVTGQRFEFAEAGESLPSGERLTATLTLHASVPVTMDAAPGGGPALDTIIAQDDGLRLVYVGSTVIYERLDAQPRIRWASHSEVVSSQDKRVDLLSSGDVPADQVVLSDPGPVATGQSGHGAGRRRRHGLDHHVGERAGRGLSGGRGRRPGRLGGQRRRPARGSGGRRRGRGRGARTGGHAHGHTAVRAAAPAAGGLAVRWRRHRAGRRVGGRVVVVPPPDGRLTRSVRPSLSDGRIGMCRGCARCRGRAVPWACRPGAGVHQLRPLSRRRPGRPAHLQLDPGGQPLPVPDTPHGEPGHRDPPAQPLPHVHPVQPPGQIPGHESVPGTHHVHGRDRNSGHRERTIHSRHRSPFGALLDHDLTNPTRQQRLHPTHHGQLLGIPHHDPGRQRQRPQHLRRGLPGPQPGSVVHIETNLPPGIDGMGDSSPGGGRRRRGQRGRDPGNHQQPRTVRQRRQDVRHGQPRAGRPGPVVPDPSHVGGPLLPNQQPRRGRVHLNETDIDPLGQQPRHDQPTELVVPDPPDPPHRVPEPGQTHGDGRLGSRHAQPQRLREPQGSGLDGPNDGHRLAERHHVGHPAATCRNSRARAARAPRSPPSAASRTNGEPTPTATAPCARYSGTSSEPTPPTGTIGTSGYGCRSAARYDGPPNEAGKIFTTAAPNPNAVSISVGVSAPANIGSPAATATGTESVTDGLTANCAPASSTRRTSPSLRTVPAPSMHPAGTDEARSASTDNADRPVNGTSTSFTPASNSVSTDARTASGLCPRTIASNLADPSSSVNVTIR